MTKKREELLRELEEESRKSTLDGVYFLQALAERSGMSLTDLQCVAILASTGPVSAGQLAETMGLTTGAVTGVINRMEKAGYVRREKDASDGRRVVVRPVLEELERVGAGLFHSQEGELEAMMSDCEDRDVAIILDFVRKSNVVTREEISRVRSASKGGGAGEFSAPLGSVESGRLVFAKGADRISLRAVSGMDDLYKASFEGAIPTVSVEGGTVTFRYSKRFGLFEWRRQSGEVTVNAGVPWEVEMRGGASGVEADLTGSKISSFVLKGGISDFSLTLPEPSGVVPVRLSGGASKVKIRRPGRVEARVRVKGGAATLTFDAQSFDAVGGAVRLQSPGYDGASDRYDIELAGGASEISIR